MQMADLSIGLAFLAGLVSFLSPCVLPLVPSYLGFIAGTAVPGNDTRGLAQTPAPPRLGRTLWFIAGFGLVFLALGVLFAGGGLAAGPFLPVIRVVSGILVMVFALNLVFHFLPFLEYAQRLQVRKRPANGLGAALVGMAFAAGWTPCIGPILASILLLAGTGATLGQGLVLLSAYTVGLGLPFLAVSLGLDRFKPVLAWMRRHARLINLVSAAILAVMGALIAFGQMTILTRVTVQAGMQLQEWASRPESTPAANVIASVVFGLLLILPGIFGLVRSLRHRSGRRGWPLALASLATLAGIALLYLEWSHRISLVLAVSGWLQFQGI